MWSLSLTCSFTFCLGILLMIDTWRPMRLLSFTFAVRGIWFCHIFGAYISTGSGKMGLMSIDMMFYDSRTNSVPNAEVLLSRWLVVNYLKRCFEGCWFCKLCQLYKSAYPILDISHHFMNTAGSLNRTRGVQGVPSVRVTPGESWVRETPVNLGHN